jgi:hypothetical protein
MAEAAASAKAIRPVAIDKVIHAFAASGPAVRWISSGSLCCRYLEELDSCPPGPSNPGDRDGRLAHGAELQRGSDTGNVHDFRAEHREAEGAGHADVDHTAASINNLEGNLGCRLVTGRHGVAYFEDAGLGSQRVASSSL